MYHNVNIIYDTSQNKVSNIVTRKNTGILSVSQGIVFETHGAGVCFGKNKNQTSIHLLVWSPLPLNDVLFLKDGGGRKRTREYTCFSYIYEEIRKEGLCYGERTLDLYFGSLDRKGIQSHSGNGKAGFYNNVRYSPQTVAGCH